MKVQEENVRPPRANISTDNTLSTFPEIHELATNSSFVLAIGLVNFSGVRLNCTAL